MRGFALGCLLALALVCAPAAGAAPLDLQDGSGLHVVSVKQLDPRLYAVVVTTKALPSPANVYVLLPPDYATAPAERWPVFYLLHGTSGTASDWTLKGDAEKVIGDREVITVMPDIALNVDGGGWCTDWPGGGESWETFHIDQLIPWVDSNFRTQPRRQKRAIAGLSQGGFCSLSYAARHPDLFSVALGYSGAPDIYYDPLDRTGAMLIINGTEIGLTHVPPNTFFGNQLTNGINWAAHDPATLAENLRWTRMYMYWGNGQPGPYDSDPSSYGGVPVEAAINQTNIDFQRRLNALSIPAYFDAYGPGTHAWPYWTRDLKESIDRIMADFATPARNPAGFTYTSADDAYSVYGWHVAMQRTAREFSTLSHARCHSFALSGSGSGAVTTKPCLVPGASYVVRLSGSNRSSTQTATADPGGRLTLTVPLGPANQFQEDTPQADAAGTNVYTTRVTMRRARG